MFARLRSMMRTFREAPAGERFQRLYYRRESIQSGVFAGSFFLGTGLTIMTLGLVLMPAPGPGTVILIIGAAIAAQESIRVARAMDWCEARLTHMAKRAIQWWRNRSMAAKGLLIVTTAASATGLGFAGYRLVAAVFAGGF